MKLLLVSTILKLSWFASSIMAQSTETEPEHDTDARTMPTFSGPPPLTRQGPQQNDDESNNRYIIKFKRGSAEFEERMSRARRKYLSSAGSSSKNLRNTETETSVVDDALLTYGSFLPKDNAEVVYLNSVEEVKKWNEKDEVELVEHGMYFFIFLLRFAY